MLLDDTTANAESAWDLLDEKNYDVAFDGRHFSYIPQPGWRDRVSDKVQLHTETADEVDRITYQVIRHSLWNVNEEHGATVQKVSGSPIAHYATDLNPSLVLEDGEYVFGGPYIQLMSGTADVYVRYILEHLSENPGINDGDVFLSDDPWIAGYHQQDHYVMQPVFWEGKIFCWVVDTLHHADCGGSLPGSFCVDAESTFNEPLGMPPFKLVEGGELRTDLERLFARRSRVPDLVRLDLRSQLAGAHVARERILRMIERYGAPVVKAVMRQVVDQAEESFVRKLEQIPDGKWVSRNYIEAALPGDRGVYRMVLELEKRGDMLIFSNDGTDPAFGAQNCTWSAWRSYIIPAINACLAADQLYAGGGAMRHCVFKPNPGSLVNAMHPSAVGAAIATMTVVSQAAQVVSRMLEASPLHEDILTPSGLSGALWVGAGGVDQWGNPFATISMDQMSGALGAMPHRDGLSMSGMFWNPKSSIPNVEATEQSYPQLYLHRRENRGGGAGRFRGGDAVASAWISHGGGSIAVSPTGAGIVPPTGLGISGGLPGLTGSFKLVRDSNVRAQLAAGVVPQEIDELGGDVYIAQAKEANIAVGGDDVWFERVMGGAGYGDPLQREPAAVAVDVANRQYSDEIALARYGVVLDSEGAVDEGATEAARAAALRERLDGATVATTTEARSLDKSIERQRFLGQLSFAADGDGEVYVCDVCDHVLGPVGEHYKAYAAFRETGLEGIGAGFGEGAEHLDERLVWREYYCPSCGTMHENELAKPDEGQLVESRLRRFDAS
jgi:N-methylhydantoinase B